MQTGKASTRYERPTQSGSLYEAFKREREGSVRARDVALSELAERHRAYGHELTAWYRQRLKQERTQGLKGALRRESFQRIAAERKKHRKERVEREREERRQARAAHPISSWQGYLEAEAAKGNEQALAALRCRQGRARQLETEVLTAENADQARHVVHGHMKPAIRRDGRVIYSVTDGGIVSDEAAHVRVPQPTTAAAFLALSLAADRFGDRPLIVKGTGAFCLQLAAVAAIEGMSVRFADPALERERVKRLNAPMAKIERVDGERDAAHSR